MMPAADRTSLGDPLRLSARSCTICFARTTGSASLGGWCRVRMSIGLPAGPATNVHNHRYTHNAERIPAVTLCDWMGVPECSRGRRRTGPALAHFVVVDPDFSTSRRTQGERMQGGLSGGHKIRRSRLGSLGCRHVTTRLGHDKGTNQDGTGTSR
jgi:hypothetical protein